MLVCVLGLLVYQELDVLQTVKNTVLCLRVPWIHIREITYFITEQPSNCNLLLILLIKRIFVIKLKKA